MPMSRNSQKTQTKKQPVKKQWKAALSKPSATLAKKAKNSQPKVLKKKAASALEVIGLFQRYYPDAHCALDFETPFQLLVATILSAQCTDERVNKVTPQLFSRYPSAFEMSKASVADIEELIKSTNFFRNKARSLKSMSEVLIEKHKGEVPQDIESLVELAGVGRKTANVVLGNAFDITSGIVVDTHVTRLAGRMGWTKSENAVVIEQELQKIIPREHWIQISHWLITHGRAVCKARKPECDNCFLFELCPKILKNK